MRGLALVLTALALVCLATPAAAHAAELTFAFEEGEACPEDRLSCILVEGGPGTEANVRDDAARVVFQGVHPVEIEIVNRGDVDHNLTFEPGTPLGNYSRDDPLGPGESASFNFTTVEDVPPGDYGFRGGMPGHADAGERGSFEIQPAPDAAGDDDAAAAEVTGIPAPGLASLALAALAAAGLRSRRG